MARKSTRSLWKGAITFGLAHIPIGHHKQHMAIVLRTRATPAARRSAAESPRPRRAA